MHRSLRPILAALTLLLAAGAAHALPYTAPTRADYPTGGGPVYATSADVNGDGLPDLVTANYFDGTISVLLNAGSGLFNLKVDYAVEAGVASVLAGDLNNDGKTDLVLACRGTNNTAVMLGNGTGAFNTKVDYVSGTEPVRATVADVNGDGIGDLVTLNRASNNVSVRLGTGGGAFSATRNDFATGLTPTDFDVRDINGDHCADVVTANFNNSSISILLANGTGGYLAKTDISLGSQVLAVTLGYFNADNLLDVAVANWGANRVNVLFGNGAGGFGSRINLITGTQPYSVRASDINLDGSTDIVVSNSGSATMSVLYGSGTGTFDPKVDFAVGVGPQAALAKDVSGDGEPDLLAVNQGSNTFTLRKGNVPGGFAVGDTLVDLTGIDETNNPRTLSAGNGKWRMIELCAVWCPSCNLMGKEARQVCDTWANVHPLPFEYVTVLTEGSDGGSVSTLDDAVTWRTNYQQNSPVLHANGNRQSNVRSWGNGVHTFAYPTLLILNPSGVIKEITVGGLSGQEVVDHIAAFAGIAPSPTLAPPLPPLPPPPPQTPTLPWHALATATIEVSYGNATWSGALGAPVTDDVDLRVFRLQPVGVPGIPNTAYIAVQAMTDSTTELETYYVLVGTNDVFDAIQTAQPWKVRLTNMVWDDNQPRILAPGGTVAQVLTVTPDPTEGFDVYHQTPLTPALTYGGAILGFAAFPLSGVPGLDPSTNAFVLANAQTKHQFALVDAGSAGASTLRLAAPVPNPARTGSILHWALARAGQARMRVIDVSGRLVRTLHDGPATAGDHSTTWDLLDAHGTRVAPGLYFVALETDGQPMRTTRLVVVR
jgi:hypothetical protein